MTPKTPSPGIAPGLPAARLFDVHDMLTLALDATEGDQPQHWQMPQARGYLRNALRQLGRVMQAQGVQA